MRTRRRTHHDARSKAAPSLPLALWLYVLGAGAPIGVALRDRLLE